MLSRVKRRRIKFTTSRYIRHVRVCAVYEIINWRCGFFFVEKISILHLTCDRALLIMRKAAGKTKQYVCI